MSQVLINQYLAQLDLLKKVGGTHRESVVREAFKDLLKGWGRQHDLVFIPEYKLDSATRDTRFVDGALLHELRVPFGYWEAKDAKDDLDEEIAFKFKRGYPQDNIVFEDSTQAVLIQNRAEVMRCGVTDVQQLEKLLKLFFAYERAEIADFRKAVAQFKTDLPAVLEALRAMIEAQFASNAAFREASAAFLTHAQEAINPALTAADVREMLIQHILTEEIFSKVFDSEFHRDNNVARELYKLEETFFTGGLKRATLKGLEAYYAAIRAAAAQIGSHHEKQAFLKLIYENFYKVYNPKAADRLGVVYTPGEIVRFMIEGADWLCEKHFGRNLIDKNVEILDPATGTGTFVCELLEHFRGQPAKLAHKYREELHANEVAILPYYVANLNIEATYAAITGEYEEFKNLCFVDTLDNVGLHTAAHGVTHDLFGSVSEENVARIKRQNARKISVIIGNPPYNANQVNENDNNKNREYPSIDKRIKQTYIHESTAQKTKLYDMYARFFRWASDRLAADGVLTFVTNRSFIDSRTFDGFRKVVAQEFAEVYVMDLGGDVRANPKLSGTKHNVFGIQTGVAISFLVKRHGAAGKKGARVFYARRPEMETAEEKLAWLGSARASELAFDEVRPDAKQNWLNVTSNDFDELMPVATKEAKQASEASRSKVIFKLFSLGIVTNRDEWVYSDDQSSLEDRVRFFCDAYAADAERWRRSAQRQATSDFVDRGIKWTSELETHMQRGTALAYDPSNVYESLYRPYVRRLTYFAPAITHRPYQNFSVFPSPSTRNPGFSFSAEDRAGFAVLAFDRLPNKDMFLPNAGQTVCLWRWDEAGNRIDNITDWALKQFQQHYQPGSGKKSQPITKEAIFHYVYAVLHDPVYREKYAQNLKREFPRIPFYADFWQWAGWGKALMDMHIGYESVEPWPLTRIDVPDDKARAAGQSPKPVLKSDKDAGTITLDSETTLTGVPREAWAYQLGNRCAIDWVLDQHKEKKPKDPTIRARFDTYRFADHKDAVIDLLRRVTRVSVETVDITARMKAAPH
ncbi:MAG: N-6 DNA methylase [Immundisolibacter sp.]|uniref:type ISP restriction/modification enzyme n=1 Tax=Immundisolibacter sp. TaxID=1934948 RepID=UPI0019839C99|nr:type ISP restriction/modification enzyme [Immundisolibacter sp.]MBC7161239.1 N-6 DNA methylase [Immundisolibacter sp.]